jgi:hypothetical protein
VQPQWIGLVNDVGLSCGRVLVAVTALVGVAGAIMPPTRFPLQARTCLSRPPVSRAVRVASRSDRVAMPADTCLLSARPIV